MIEKEEIDEALEDLCHSGTTKRGLFGYKAYLLLLKMKNENRRDISTRFRENTK